MPTSIFSNHTGFDSFYFKDFTENMPPYMAEWKKLNLKFDGIVTGFLGSHNQIAIVEEFLLVAHPIKLYPLLVNAFLVNVTFAFLEIFFIGLIEPLPPLLSK